ncbi:hypothetical protein HAX54_008994, partial [Datura stramonium]|nr:hypothetical protein [Datura stramonium]
ETPICPWYGLLWILSSTLCYDVCSPTRPTMASGAGHALALGWGVTFPTSVNFDHFETFDHVYCLDTVR